MLSHISVARIKDKTAHSSLNHWLFPAAVTLPPAQRSLCQDLRVGNSQRSSPHSPGLPSDFPRRRSRGRCSARRGRAAWGTGFVRAVWGTESLSELHVAQFVPSVGHGSAGAQGDAGSAACREAQPSCSAFPACLSRARIGGALSFVKAREDVFRPVRIVPQDMPACFADTAKPCVVHPPPFLARHSWGVSSVIRLSSSCRMG